MWPGSEGLGPGSPCAFVDLAVGARQLVSLGFEQYLLGRWWGALCIERRLASLSCKKQFDMNPLGHERFGVIDIARRCSYHDVRVQLSIISIKKCPIKSRNDPFHVEEKRKKSCPLL